MTMSLPNSAFEERIYVAKKKGLFDFSDPEHREQLYFDKPIPDFALLKDIFFRCVVPPLANEDPAGIKIAIGFWNARGFLIGRADKSGDLEIGQMVPGKQWHPVSANYGPGLADPVGRNIWVRKDYFFRGSGNASLQLNMSLLPLSVPYTNEDFEIDICCQCLVLK